MDDLMITYAPELGRRSLIIHEGRNRDLRIWFDTLDELRTFLRQARRSTGLSYQASKYALQDAAVYMEADPTNPRCEDDARTPPGEFNRAFQWFSAWALVGLACATILWGKLR